MFYVCAGCTSAWAVNVVKVEYGCFLAGCRGLSIEERPSIGRIGPLSQTSILSAL